MKSKGLKIILIILILLTGSAGGIGFVQSKKQTANNPNEEKNKIYRNCFGYFVLLL